MCGINGIFSFSDDLDLSSKVEKMNSLLHHRGPDDAGVYQDGKCLAIGHRRLSIIDLSREGHQPMTSACGRYVLAFNGEIYNFRSLRQHLSYPFRSHTDSEVILAAWSLWGSEAITRLSGMFAFALWDTQNQTLHLVRDRTGIKPLYYHITDQHLIFSSEVRALLSGGLTPRRVNRSAIVDYLRYQCVHEPETIVENVALLPPATHMTIHSDGRHKLSRYWAPQSVDIKLHGSKLTDQASVQKAVTDTLERVVERHLEADVPYGAFLSGGIDSSVIVGMMSRLRKKVSTFSVTFAEEQYSEARFARQVAEKFKTDHHEIRLTPDDFLALLPDALDHMDHPSGDGPNTYVVSRATRQAGIKMALSGLGGDELFAGYDIFTRMHKLQKARMLNLLPRALRSELGHCLRRLRPGIASDKLSALLSLPEITPVNAYPIMRQVLSDIQITDITNLKTLPDNRVAGYAKRLESSSAFDKFPICSQVSILEIASYLGNVLLRDADQMSMAHSLEVRVPFLDHELIELALSIPDKYKLTTPAKGLLINSLGKDLPEAVYNRPKMGFVLPYARWMSNDLKDFCQQRIELLAHQPYFDSENLMQAWQGFLQGKPGLSWSRLWMLVVLGHWLERNRLT